MKLLLDENLSPRHVSTLNALGHSALSIWDAHMSGAPDPVIREFAINEGRILVTLDGDFGNIMRFPPGNTPGVIWLRPKIPTEVNILSLLENAVHALSEFDMTGKLAVVESDKIRVCNG